MIGLFKNIETVNESRQQIKRKWGQYSAIKVNEKTPIRNHVIDFVGNRFVTEDELLQFLNQLTEDRGKDFNAKLWFERNSKYFESFTNRGQNVMVLSKYGKRIFDGIINPSKNKQLNESEEDIQNDDVSLLEKNKFNGKEILPDWISSKDIGKVVKSISDLEVDSYYVIYEPGMDVWNAEAKYLGKIGGNHQFEFIDGAPRDKTTVDLEFSDNEIKNLIKDKEIYTQI